jgi:S1-C subfamily serine protease/CheY-like chemotaxis protein
MTVVEPSPIRCRSASNRCSPLPVELVFARPGRQIARMATNAGKLLVVESDEQLRAGIVSALNEAGYEVSTDYSAGMKSVLAFEPDLVVLGADPPDLDCCDLLSEIKGTEHTREIRVVMLSHGGATERARGLDLGADDALSLPFEPHELLSRIRAQLREREQLRRAEDDRKATEQVVTAVNEERRTIRVGALLAVAVLIVAGLVSAYFYRRSQAQNARVYAAITKLQAGMLTQGQILQMSRKASDSVVQSRISKLESAGSAAQTIIQTYEPSVCLIHITLAFRDHTSGQKLHYAGMTDSGGPTVDEHSNPLVSLTGYGPEVHIDAFGTGFLASANGEILTNHHVAEPWWQSDEIKELLSQGLDPVIIEMRAYFPDVPHGITIDTERISSAADVAIVRGDVSGLGIKTVALGDGHGAVSGAPIVLLGYPTAIDAILARAGSATLQSIAHASKGDPTQVMEELARRHLIRPITTQGHIGDVLADRIVYDAQTTSGGSGGPLFNDQGKVIGINFAILRQFGGSNFAIPIDFGEALLAGSTDRAGTGTAAR